MNTKWHKLVWRTNFFSFSLFAASSFAETATVERAEKRPGRFHDRYGPLQNLLLPSPHRALVSTHPGFCGKFNILPPPVVGANVRRLSHPHPSLPPREKECNFRRLAHFCDLC